MNLKRAHDRERREGMFLVTLGAQGELDSLSLWDQLGREVFGPLVQIYIIGEGLERRGLVSSRSADPTPERGMRPRKYWKLVEEPPE